MTRFLALVGLTAVALAGCVSAAPSEETQEAAPAVVAGSSKCQLTNKSALSSQFGVTFRDPRLLSESTDTDVRCQWTSVDGFSIVQTRHVTTDAGVIYEEARSTAARQLGIVSKVEVPGSKKAFQVAPMGVTGMLKGPDFVQVTVGVVTASPEDQILLATRVFANVR